MEAWLAIAAVLTCVFVLYAARYPRAKLQLFRDRPCQGRLWSRAFPNAPKSEIRAFLSLFCESFVFKAHDRMKFKPDDEVLAIYRAKYPERWMPDALELELLDRMLKTQYSFQLNAVWRDQITLGEIFELTQGRSHEV